PPRPEHPSRSPPPAPAAPPPVAAPWHTPPARRAARAACRRPRPRPRSGGLPSPPTARRPPPRTGRRTARAPPRRTQPPRRPAGRRSRPNPGRRGPRRARPRIPGNSCPITPVRSEQPVHGPGEHPPRRRGLLQLSPPTGVDPVVLPVRPRLRGHHVTRQIAVGVQAAQRAVDRRVADVLEPRDPQPPDDVVAVAVFIGQDRDDR